MAWSVNGTTNTLSNAGNTLNITDLTASNFNVFLTHAIGKSTNQGIATTLFGSSGGGDYYQRKSINAAADGTDSAQAAWYDQSVRTDTDDSFAIHYISNISGREKFAIEYAVNQNGTGAGTAPEMLEFVGKYTTTTNSGQFTRIDCVGSAGTMAIGSNITALNGDATEETILGNNVQSGSRFEATDTRKIYYRALPSITDSTLNSTDGTTGWDMTNAGSSISLDTTNNEVDFLLPTGTKSCYYDLGANVSQSWVLRFATTWSGAGSNNPVYWIGLSNQANIIANSTLVTGAFIIFYGGSSYKMSVPVNSRIDQAGANQVNLSPTTTCNATPYWVEIIKNGSTSITVSIYPNSSYATPTATYTLNVDISSYNLRYLTGVTYNQGSGVTGTFSDVKFYNGVTSTTDLVWTEES